MSKHACMLTTKDFTILEVMRDRCPSGDDLLVSVLRRKLETAIVMFREDIPPNVATLSSRVMFSVDGQAPETRVLSGEREASPHGMFLPITTPRGLALLGLAEGEGFAIVDGAGNETHILMQQVLYQPEAARRKKEASNASSAVAQRKPVLRLVRGGYPDAPRFAPAGMGGPDDPGPSAA